MKPPSKSNLRVKHARRGAACLVELSGVLDETFDCQTVLRGIQGEGPTLFDLEGLAKTTSFGVKQWRLLLQSLTGPYWLMHCKPAFIYQANMIEDYLGRAQVISFYLPYACTSCGAARDVLCDLTETLIDEGSTPPTVEPCESCGAEMELEEEPSSYFSFLHTARVQSLPNEVQELLEERPETGDVLVDVNMFGHYALLSRLGYGGLAEVWLARDQRSGGETVIKLPLPHVRRDKAAAARLDQEASILAKIDHPNVVKMLEHGRVADCPYLALEYVDGYSLAQILRMLRGRRQPVPILAACVIAEELCRGLHAVHVANVVHGDLSPDNVLVSRDGKVKLTDFGSATNASMRKRGASLLAEGKTPYLAPEYRSTDASAVDHRADIFSAGVILYECIGGRHPFSTSVSEMDSMLPNAGEKVALPIGTLRKNVPPLLGDLLARTLGPIEGRPPTAAHLGRELLQIRGNQSADIAAFVDDAMD